MSRRLAISSLLCDEDQPPEPQIIPEPVVLAPHLRRSPPLVTAGLNALAVAAAEERSRNYGYAAFSQEQRRHIHREQILGYNTKSDALPGPGMRNILSPTTPYEEPSHKRRRYSDEYERMRQQDDADRYRRQEEERQLARRIQQETDEMERFRQLNAARSAATLPSRRAGYDPVHNDHHPQPLRVHRSVEVIEIPEREQEGSHHRITSPPYRDPHIPSDIHQYSYPHIPSPHVQYYDPGPNGPPPPVPDSRFSASPHHPVPDSRFSASPHHHVQHRVISPPAGRRSPPGSQAGRAIAAKKVEQEHQIPGMESPLVKRESPVDRKKERRTSRPKEASPSSVKPEVTSPLPPPPPPPPQQPILEEDPHEWLLEHYADYDRQKIERPHPIAPSSVAVTPVPTSVKPDPGRRSTASPVARKASKSPVLSSSMLGQHRDDAILALEQELDAELTEVVVAEKPLDPNAMDVDVDQAVAELVDETLGADAETPVTAESEVQPEPELEPNAMEVDVEDELLSLLDDQPNSHMSASGSASVPSETKSNKPSSSSSSSLKVKAPVAAPPALRLKKEETTSRPSSPLTVSVMSPLRPSSASGVRQSSVKPSEQEDRESMPPPSTPKEMSVTAPQKKRGKPGPKPKPRNPDGTIVGAPPPLPPKPRGKPGPKPKPRDEFGNIIRTPAAAATASTSTSTSASAFISAPPKGSTSRATSSATPAPPTQVSRTASGSHAAVARASSSGARSRSTSAHPVGSVGPEGEIQAQTKEEDKIEDKDDDDDKLYCLCRTKYDEDKPMIACDSCDEWYHMKCVEIPEHKGDLVDQFFCPTCIEKSPSANLQTTYKMRCLFGLNHLDPDSPKACHKPARTFSKYCSEECGVKNLRKKIDTFTKKGGKKEDLWESVRTASKREGLVRVIEPPPAMQLNPGGGAVEVDMLSELDLLKPVVREIKPTKTKQEREIERLDGLLAKIEKDRERLRRGMDIILSREKLLQLASERSESMGQCGWDQRLCFSDEDWTDYGEGVLESYAKLEGSAENNNMEEAEWWCPGDPDCERHHGWQGLRAMDVEKEKEKKEEALIKLTSREREIRKRIDRIQEERDYAGPLLGNAPRRNTSGAQKGGNNHNNSNNGKLSNGHSTTKAKVNGDAPKKGKKRKVPS